MARVEGCGLSLSGRVVVDLHDGVPMATKSTGCSTAGVLRWCAHQGHGGPQWRLVFTACSCLRVSAARLLMLPMFGVPPAGLEPARSASMAFTRCLSAREWRRSDF